MARPASDTTVLKKRIKELEAENNLLKQKVASLNNVADSTFARERETQMLYEDFTKQVNKDMLFMETQLDAFVSVMNRVLKRGDN